ncbi:MAG TPA: DinB family protein [Mycobacteriales bacterium]|nr:DinB family protein [Mycobacteriales bacterium]
MRTPPVAPELTTDTKDWTWVLSRGCPECGTDTHALPAEEIGPHLLRSADALVAALQLPGAVVRPRPDVWSPLEYACHVRDVCRVFALRLHRMLSEDGPSFENWDQDAAAVADGYGGQDPLVVSRQLLAEARTLAGAFDAVPEGSWGRPGYRSDGAAFTVLTLGRYLAHDPAHHVHDVTRSR